MRFVHRRARCLAYRLMVMSARCDRELVGVDSYLKVSALIEIWPSTGLPKALLC